MNFSPSSTGGNLLKWPDHLECLNGIKIIYGCIIPHHYRVYQVLYGDARNLKKQKGLLRPLEHLPFCDAYLQHLILSFTFIL